ncbi:MAG: ABC transporter ATP-binding protein [Tissierellales bacterium]
MLRIEKLSKAYRGGKKAVDNLSLEIKKGDIYGFIGHNGAGKTTTIKSITGILDFDEGDIFIDGMSIKDKPIECKKVMAYIPDNPDLYENMTGIQYLNFIADIFGVPKEVRERDIDKYSNAFELTKNLGDLVSSYSHGMKQKLAIISALIHQPKLLILDEPFVGLDPKASHTLKEYMKEMCQEGSAIFFSTHILEVAEKLCNRIAIIKAGKLIASGETHVVKGDSSLEELFLEVTGNE